MGVCINLRKFAKFCNICVNFWLNFYEFLFLFQDNKRLSAGMDGISKDYKYLEFVKNSVKKTTSGPSIEWCMNKDVCIGKSIF